MTGVVKAFGPTQALKDASFELLPGEVHCLAGENGSGKSTLMKILSGVHVPDQGNVELLGIGDVRFQSPHAAQENGIGTVFQEVLVAESRSVLDNVWLGTEGPLRARRSRAESAARASEVLHELLGTQLKLETPVAELPLSDRQSCCIVRALLREPRILILDEATSALDIATRDRLFEIIKRLAAQGAGIVFITHRMDEVDAIADRITVMRNGATVGTLERGNWSTERLVQMMTGAEHLTNVATRDRSHHRSGPVVLSTTGLKLSASGAPIDIEVRAGELVGVAGLEGHGQEAFLHALRGAGSSGAVVRHEDGGETVVRSPAQAAQHGIVYVPRERVASTFRWMSIRENFGLPTLRADRRFGLMRPAATRRRLAEFVDRLSIVLGQAEDPITTLSGGNQQKVIVARWLAANPRVLLLNDPTRGIDIGAKRDLYRLLVEMSEQGLAVVMLSTELDEHVELADRVFVFREQELAQELSGEEITRRRLVTAFFGRDDDDDSSEGT